MIEGYRSARVQVPRVLLPEEFITELRDIAGWTAAKCSRTQASSCPTVGTGSSAFMGALEGTDHYCCATSPSRGSSLAGHFVHSPPEHGARVESSHWLPPERADRAVPILGTTQSRSSNVTNSEQEAIGCGALMRHGPNMMDGPAGTNPPHPCPRISPRFTLVPFRPDSMPKDTTLRERDYRRRRAQSCSPQSTHGTCCGFAHQPLVAITHW
jgi:hypothetical protein